MNASFDIPNLGFVIRPVCLWLLAKSKAADAKRGFPDRRNETLSSTPANSAPSSVLAWKIRRSTSREK